MQMEKGVCLEKGKPGKPPHKRRLAKEDVDAMAHRWCSGGLCCCFAVPKTLLNVCPSQPATAAQTSATFHNPQQPHHYPLHPQPTHNLAQLNRPQSCTSGQASSQCGFIHVAPENVSWFLRAMQSKGFQRVGKWQVVGRFGGSHCRGPQDKLSGLGWGFWGADW